MFHQLTHFRGGNHHATTTDYATQLHAVHRGCHGKLSGPSERQQRNRAVPAAVKIHEPFHGAVLNHRHGKQSKDGLAIRVSGEAPPGDRITVNGVPCRREGKQFTAEVTLRKENRSGRRRRRGGWGASRPRTCGLGPVQRATLPLLHRRQQLLPPRHRYKKGYKSLFDCWYLKMLRDLHDKYGVKYTVNIYYTTGEDFKLPQFPNRYKGEWRDNSHWMKLAFHAYADKPDRPYQDAPPRSSLTDLDLVAGEIRRFAGEEAYAPPTVIHWAMTRHTAFKPLASRGVRVLTHLTARNRGAWDINYRWDDAHSEYLSRHNAWKDFDSGIVFSRVSIVCNGVPVDRIVGTLEPLAKDPNLAEIMDLFTHEQYFWPFYRNYIPDHPRRLDVAIRWVTEHGYKPVFFHEGFLGGRE